MTNAKPILYGVSDFVRMRTEGAYYIDRTAYIRELEKTSYVMFLRPRRFGKSLLVSMLQCYYDIHYADRFDELFGGLAIHDDPTPEHGKYLILDFNFTGVEKQVGLVQDSFNDYCSYRIDKFAKDHAARLPEGTSEDILKATSCNAKLARLATGLKGSKIRYLVTVNRRINGNYHRLEEIIAEKGCTAQIEDSFQARELTKGDNFVSLLFYFGLLAIRDRDFDGCRLVVPNLTVQEFINDFIPRAYEDVYGIDSSVYDIARSPRHRLPGRRPRPL